jgi:cell division protein ZapA (FtsZ GTPase activity inhibitor)
MIFSITRAKVSTSRILACATIVLSISGCAGLSALQDSVSHLDQAAHSAATAEAAFLVALNVADCESQFYKQTYLYSSGAATNFQIAKYCSPQVITPAQIKIRNDLMSAVVLYADKMMALASTDSDKTLSTDSQTVAGNLKKLAGSGSGTSTIVAGVAAAFTAIAELALDEKRYKNLQEAATAMQTSIDTVIDALTAENRAFSVTIVAADKVLESQLRAEAASAKTVVEKFNAIVRAREILAAESGQSLAALGTIDWDATDLSKPISDSLPGIKTANAAIAKGSSANIYAAAHDLYARASAARDLYTSISTAK